jgi:hypothetical protein
VAGRGGRKRWQEEVAGRSIRKKYQQEEVSAGRGVGNLEI